MRPGKVGTGHAARPGGKVGTGHAAKPGGKVGTGHAARPGRQGHSLTPWDDPPFPIYHDPVQA